MATQTSLAELRDVLRDILAKYDPNCMEETVVAIMSAARMAYTEEASAARRRGTKDALLVGLSRMAAIKYSCTNRFHVNYSWNSKCGQDLLEFLGSVPEDQTVDKFADWWETQDWRGKQHQAPTLIQIYENWPQAFVKKESTVPVFHAEDEA